MGGYMKEKNVIIPRGFFSTIRDVITNKEALKDVIPINWNEASEPREDNEKQVVKLVKNNDMTNKKNS